VGAIMTHLGATLRKSVIMALSQESRSRAAAKRLEAGPGGRKLMATMVEINMSYQGGLRVEAEHGPSGTKVVTDAPVDNHGKGESFSPTDLAATALGACMATIMGIVAEREKNGAYKDLADFAERLDTKNMNRRQFEQLAAAGAFECLNDNRAQMASSAEIILRHAHALAEERESGQVNLFGGDEAGSGLGMPDLKDVREWDALERLEREFKAVGFYLSAHPLDSREQQFENLGITSVQDVEAELQNQPNGRYHMAGVLLKKQEKVSQKGNKYAFLQLSDPTGIFEVTLFSEVLAVSREFLEPGTPLLLTVEAEVREDQIRYTTTRLDKLDEALEGKIREIQIHMESAAAAPRIKEFLDIEGQGKSRVSFYVTVPDGRVAKMDLPGRWSLSQQARNIIRNEDGVVEIAEA